ncbi:PAS domain-containing sensor histidine kinase [Candidatus Latescibacterota bacterium]
MKLHTKNIRVISPKLILALTILCIIAVSASVYFEYRAQREDYLMVLQRQAMNVHNILSRSINNSIIATEQIESIINNQILTNLQTIERMDRIGRISLGRFEELREISDYEALLFFDPRGIPRLRAVKSDSVQPPPIPPPLLLHRMRPSSADTVITLYDFRDITKERRAAFVRCRNGGLLVAVISFEDIRSLQSSLGIGYILKNFQSEENIKYLLIQNRETIAAGSFSGYDISRYSSDPVLREALNNNEDRSRILYYDDKPLFETISPFYLNGSPFGVIRLGLSMDEYEKLKTDMRKRLYLFGAVLIFVGLIIVNFLISYRHRKLLQHDLERLRHNTNTILENLVSGVISIDQNGLIQSINKQALSILNLEYGDVIYQHYSALPELLEGKIEDCLGSDLNAPSVSRHWVSAPDSPQRLFSLLTHFTEDENSNKICVILINDITDQTQLEEQMKRNQRLTAMQNLASSVAHEIKNPLNSIQLIVDLIRKKFKPADEADIYTRNLDTVKEEIKRISDIVEQYLRFTRPPKMSYAQVDFPELLQEVSLLFESEMKENDITFTRDMDAHQPLKGDRDQLKQVFINVVKNAREAIEEAGEITITGEISGEYYEIRVRDSGSGIFQKDINSIFDFHFTTKKDGSGIGLSVVQRIMTAHNGIINVESIEGHGTSFVLQFPLIGYDNEISS